MKILYGTSNEAKISSMKKNMEFLNRKMDGKLELEIIGFNDINKTIPKVSENGSNPLENARIKALSYYKAFHIPVFSCDSGLYFANLPDEFQPGVNVRTVNGKRLNDEKMIQYYSNLAQKYGNLRAKYKNAICFIFNDEQLFELMDSSLESEEFMITSKPHSKRRNGFPLDSLSVDIETGKYFYDLPEKSSEKVESGFIQFFENAFQQMNYL